LNGITLQVPLKTVKDSGHLYIEKTVEGLKRFLIRCSNVVKVHEIPILLVGGGSRLSGLKEAIEVLAPGRVVRWNHSDYATVLGAATPLLKTVPTRSPQPQRYREVVKNFIDEQNFTIKTLEDLHRMSTQLGLSKEQASQIETEVLGMPKELFFDFIQEKKLKEKENLSRYREGVASRNFLGINNFTIIDLKHLTGMSTELRLSNEQASQIETEVLGMPKEQYYDLSSQKQKENLSRYREEVKAKNFLGKHNFTIKNLEDLTRMSTELGLSKEQAIQIETEVLGMPKGLFYDSRPTPPGKPQKAGEVITNELGMKFAWIPSGTFVMGSPESEAGRSSNETSHKVTITKGFYLGIYTVTQVQWEGLMGSNPSTYKGADLPVYGVSWEDCQEFIQKLNAKTNGGYRLPTEAEWEYACRAGSTTVYSFGDVITLKDANYCSSIFVSIFTLFFLDSPKAVGSYKSNAFGLHDMHGNVEEWCEDWYADYPAGAVTDPKGPATGTYRVLRGGSFHGVDSHARSSSRSGIYQGDPLCTYGFRLAWTP
jgi:formylglycine-generating enzyme required for sulfatase activity